MATGWPYWSRPVVPAPVPGDPAACPSLVRPPFAFFPFCVSVSSLLSLTSPHFPYTNLVGGHLSRKRPSFEPFVLFTVIPSLPSFRSSCFAQVLLDSSSFILLAEDPSNPCRYTHQIHPSPTIVPPSFESDDQSDNRQLLLFYECIATLIDFLYSNPTGF